MLHAVVVPGHRPTYRLNWFVFVLLLLAAGASIGAPRIIDRIDVETGSESNNIHLFFNIPIRVISQVLSSNKRELNIQVQPTFTPGTTQDLLGRDEVLSARPSAEIPLDRIRFRPRGIGTSLIELSFVTPVQAYIVQKQKDFFSLTITLKNKKRVEQIVMHESAADEAAVQDETAVPDEPEESEEAAPSADRSLPVDPRQPARMSKGNLVINLMSQTRPINFSKVSPVQVPEGTTLYTTEAKVNGRKWYRLRLGFFADRPAAEKALKSIRRFHPKAWIDSASAGEKAKDPGATLDGEVLPPRSSAEAPKPPIRRPRKPEELPSSERLSLMMSTARDIMTAGDYPKAIRLLTAILAQPENRYTQEAQELLGLARERNGQLAHAYAEYEKYIQDYPEGEDAERVEQRLAGLVTASKKPQEALRKPRAQIAQEREESPWDVFGSLALGHRYDGIRSDFAVDSTTRSEFATDLFLSARRPFADGDVRLQVTGGYANDLLVGRSENVSTLSDAYVEYEHRPTDTYGRFGRQRLRSSGILNRFDGLVVGHKFTPDLEGRVALGFPVERSSDTFIQDNKRFVGVSVGLDSVVENTDVDLFFVEQQVDGLVDRRAIGGEVRYFEQDWSLFGLLDYDLHFGELNTALIQANWNYTPQTALYLTLDYRFSPTVTAYNALQGLSFTEIAALREIFTDDEIYELAQDRAARSKIASAGATHTFSNDLQMSGDVTLSNIGATPASGGVPAIESTGNEYFYSLQVSKPNLFKDGDIGIVSLRYTDASTSNTISLGANTRYPITDLVRVNPRLIVSHRRNEDGDGERTTVGAQIRGDYRFRPDLLLEGEVGANWYNEDDTTTGSTDFVDYYLGLGLRWEF